MNVITVKIARVRVEYKITSRHSYHELLDLKGSSVYVQYVRSLSFHHHSSIFPVGTPCTSIFQGQFLPLLQWQFVYARMTEPTPSISLSPYYPPCPVTTTSYIPAGYQIHFQGLYRERSQVVWKVLTCRAFY